MFKRSLSKDIGWPNRGLLCTLQCEEGCDCPSGQFIDTTSVCSLTSVLLIVL